MGFTIVLGIVVAYVIYRRGKRLFTKQKLSPTRHGLRVAFVSVLSVLLGLFPLTSFTLKVLGFVAGAFAAGISLKATKIFKERERWMYRPDLRIGVVLFVLVIYRVGVRVLRINELKPSAETSPWDLVPTVINDPSLSLIYVFLGYILIFEFGLLLTAMHYRDLES